MTNFNLPRRTHLSNRPGAGSPWAAAYAIAAFMVFHLFYHQNLMGLSSSVASSPAQVFGQSEYWRVFTAQFVHADLGHLLSNSFFFGGLAFLLNGYFGFWVFPVLAFLAGAVIQVAALATYDPGVTLIGASGVVYFMAAFWLTLYVGIERRLPLLRRLINAAAFTLVLLMPESFKPEVSYRTHAIGYAVGILFGGLYFTAKRSKFRANEVFAPAPAPVPALDPDQEENAYWMPPRATQTPHAPLLLLSDSGQWVPVRLASVGEPEAINRSDGKVIRPEVWARTKSI